MYSQIEQSWKNILKDEFEKEYFVRLDGKIREAYLTVDVPIFPPCALIFNAFQCCNFDDVKVVILGQDPYHGDGQAHGLAFSVPDNTKIPPSLQNIYKEIKQSCNIEVPKSGNLERWAHQGVLLLNSILTVEKNKPKSNQEIGWEKFTDTVVQKISDEKENVIFLLWGSYAQEKGKNIDTSKHLILTAPHPSPLSAYRGFLGCNHFIKTNIYLKKHSLKEIKW